MRLGVFAAASCAALSVFVSSSAWAQTVGRIDEVLVYAYATHPGAARSVAYARDVLVADQRLETVPNGALLARFTDGTALTLGGDAEIVIDRAVFDPRQPSAGQLSLTFSKGAFRYVSGAMPKEGIVLRTRSATMGIRGTDVTMVIGANGAANLHVRSGAAAVTSSAGGAPVPVGSRQSVTISPDGTVGTPTPFPQYFFGQTGDSAVDHALTSSSGMAPASGSIGNPDRAPGSGGGGGPPT